MTCQKTVEGRQAEFAFFQQMVDRMETELCCGPLTTIGFSKISMEYMHKAMQTIGLAEGYLDNYEPTLLDSTHMSLTMCPKHWIMHSRGISKLAEDTNSDSLRQLAYSMFRYTCLTNEWDYKEILNYAKSAEAIQPE